jgi:hypothetical protein
MIVQSADNIVRLAIEIHVNLLFVGNLYLKVSSYALTFHSEYVTHSLFTVAL